ncbi:hypothetical protein Y1Q_0002548 [Alligator mississippiensis]|uniref:ribonuclease H n=1 Tax=Alligator mississippiensis TaxID=8496 RepID=A0A151M179_ALLMI|nr:hypothetical protein Y1Q_0002548 [Alligator mississippiensis]
MELEHEKEQCQHKKEQREHERAVIQIQTNANTAGAQPTLDASPRLNTPNFSRYKAGDDPEVFLSIFKNQTCRWKLPKEEFMKHMTALVEDDMSVVLNSLPLHAADNYDAFKNAVSSRFRSDAVFWIASVEGSPEDPEEPVMYGDWDEEEGIEELHLPDHLTSQDKDKVLAALKDFRTVFSNKPGFWQMALDLNAIAKSAFTTPLGLYEFTVLPFGMRNSPASFQRLINNLLQGCEQFAMAYIDDITIFSQDFEPHLIYLTPVLGKI